MTSDVTLGDLAECIRGVGYDPDRDLRDGDQAGTVRLLRANNVQGGRVIRNDMQYVMEGRVSPNQELRDGDTVICMANGSRALVGKSAIFDGREAVRYTVGAFMAIVRPYDTANSRYLSAVLQSQDFRHHIDVLLSGSAINNLRPADVLSFPIALPDHSRRSRIGDSGAAFDALLDSLDAVIAKKKQIRESVMDRLMGPVAWGDTKSGWVELEFSGVLRLVNTRSHQVDAKDYASTGSVPIVDQGQSVVAGYSPDLSRALTPPLGGLIVFGDHTRAVKFVDFDFVVGADGTKVLAPQAGHSARYLAYEIQRQRIPNTGYNRHFGLLRDLKFHLPSKARQDEIVHVLATLDDEIELIGSRRAKTALIRDAAMAGLLQGFSMEVA